MTNRVPTTRSEAIWRAVEANRASYAPARRLHELEAALAEAATEASELKSRLLAFETSTIWGLTRPIRRVIQAAKSWRSLPESPDDRPAPRLQAADPASASGYSDWILNEEPSVMDALLRSGAGHAPITAPRLGLVLWTEETDASQVSQRVAATLAQIAPACEPPPCETLVLCPDPALTAVRQSFASRTDAGQTGPLFEAGTSADALPLALARLRAEFIGFHHLADQITPRALDIVRAVLAEQPQTTLLFGDEDWLGPDGERTRPFFKPGWDVELQRAQDLVGPFAFYCATLLRRVAANGLNGAGLHGGSTHGGGAAWRYDIASRVAAASLPERIRHVPAVLCHRVAPLPPGHAAAMRLHAAEHLRAQGIAAQVQPVEGRTQWQRIVYTLPKPEPLVSVIIPTRDRAELLRTCTDGVLHRTDYRRIELIIMDNGTEDPEALALIDALAKDERVRVLRRAGRFNWSALNNEAASQAEGEILLLLNNDIAVLRPDWMGAMVAHALQPGVGAVGAKLLYQDGRVQHAGITTDRSGIPRHLLRFAAGDDPGPYGLLALARSVWSVTGACMAVRRELFFEVGGLNEGLPVTYNDVELCLRLAAQGYRTVWTPAALLEHHESASRPPDHLGARREQVREELNRLHRDWGNLVLHDPYLTPNFDLSRGHVHFHRTPAVARGH